MMSLSRVSLQSISSFALIFRDQSAHNDYSPTFDTFALPQKVAIRIRPIGSNSSGESTTRAFRANKNSVVESTESKANTTSARRASTGSAEHRYDNVFGEEIDTCTIYNELVENIVSSVSNDGINGTVFTYGQTSSGKTYTMQGVEENPGVAPRAI